MRSFPHALRKLPDVIRRQSPDNPRRGIGVGSTTMKNITGQPTFNWKAVALQAVAANAAPRMEHRWGVRRPCRARVCVSAGSAIAGMGRLTNVSMSGAFLETALPLPQFSQIAIAVLHADGRRHAVELTATVVRTTRDGVGIEWCETAEGPICELMGCAMECRASAGH
jgi:hypothetical protein